MVFSVFGTAVVVLVVAVFSGVAVVLAETERVLESSSAEDDTF